MKKQKFNPELRVHEVKEFNPDEFIERERINKRFINLLSRVGRIEFKYEGRTDRHDNGDVVVHDSLYFSRGASSLEVRIKTKNFDSMEIRYGNGVFRTDGNDIELLDAVREIVYTLDEMNRAKEEFKEPNTITVDCKDVINIFISKLKDLCGYDSPTVYKVFHELLWRYPELNKEKELINEFIRIYDEKLKRPLK